MGQVIKSLFIFIITLIYSGISFADPPNIILVISDDFGWPYHGFMGNEIIHTPNLDSFAAQGTTFVNGFSVDSVCKPALRTLLSGVNPKVWEQHITNMETLLGHSIDFPNDVLYMLTLPQQLSRYGYHTFQGGKFWEGSTTMGGFEAGTQMDISACPIMQISCTGDLEGWNTFGRITIQPMWDFIDNLNGEPFFIWFAPMLPHIPFDALQPFPCPYLPTMGQQLVRCDPLWPPPDPPFVSPAIWYYANIDRFDALFGNLISGLDTRGLRDNTIVIYLTDNGYEQDPYTQCEAGTDKGCPKGKLSIYELGFRTPIVWNWPNHIPSGASLNNLVTFEDVYRTILSYAGVEAQPDRNGIDLFTLIQTGSGVTRDVLYGLSPNLYTGDDRYFARTSDWRYIHVPATSQEELYYILTDPFEENNVANENPYLVSIARSYTDQWITDLLTPKSTLEITGKLTNSEGEPLSNIRLRLAGYVWLSQYTATDGSFSFPNLAAGMYQLHVREVNNLVYDGQIMEDEMITINLNNQVMGQHLLLQAEPQ